jgi:hypothetical protein
MATETITLNYKGCYGYVEFNDETKKLDIQIPDHEDIVQKVREYLTTPHTMDVPGDKGLCEFETVTVNAMESISQFKLALTRLWVNTEVLVEWSMPPHMVENL